MSGHSPGPWRVMEAGTVWTDERMGDIPAGTLVCYLAPRTMADGEHFHAPDAHLIAAAPELLEALKIALASAAFGAPENMAAARALIRRIEEGE